MSNCIFCDIINGDLESSKIYEDKHCIVMLDLFPLKKGHTLIIAKSHQEFFANLDTSIQEHMISISHQVTKAMRRSSLLTKGVNYLINDGAAATQHVPHVHLHIIPRQGNDFWKILLNIMFRFRYFLSSKKHRKKLNQPAQELKELLDNLFFSLLGAEKFYKKSICKGLCKNC